MVPRSWKAGHWAAACRQEYGQLTGAARHADATIVSVPQDQALSLAKVLTSHAWFQVAAMNLKVVMGDLVACQFYRSSQHWPFCFYQSGRQIWEQHTEV